MIEAWTSDMIEALTSDMMIEAWTSDMIEV